MRGENDSPVEIYKSVSIERFDLKSTHEEADNFLAHQMVAASQENQKGISVVSDDTDVFVCCCIIIKLKTSHYLL